MPQSEYPMEAHLPPIFVVDDSEDDRALFLVYARKAGLKNRLVFASSAAEAIEHFDHCNIGLAPWPCASFLDIRMPGQTGFDLLSGMIERGYGGKTVIVMHSSSDDPADIKKSFRIGAHAYLRKGNVTEEIGKIVTIAMTFVPREYVLTEVAKVGLSEGLFAEG